MKPCGSRPLKWCAGSAGSLSRAFGSEGGEGFGGDILRVGGCRPRPTGAPALALHVDVRGRQWDNPVAAPGIHQQIVVSTGGTYHVWLLVKFDSDNDDACVLALDGAPQPATEQFSGGTCSASAPPSCGTGPT